MKTFNIILETDDGGRITMRDVERKSESIIQDAIDRLEKHKRSVLGPNESLKEILMPAMERLSQK